MTDTFDELRIIAKDVAALDKTDRDVISRAADELEYTYRLMIDTQENLIESNAHRIALKERVLEMYRASQFKGPFKMSYGPFHTKAKL